jgi:type III pantothenate kinase
MNILEIDAGNTRIKWRLRDQMQTAERGVAATQEELLAILPDVRVDRVRMASVRGEEATGRLCSALARRWNRDIEVARVKAEQAGVSNAYQNYASMGIDRWLAILAGYHRAPDRGCCIISCGTALTVDAVSADGLHLGGYIVPGLTLQRSSLLQHTAIRLPIDIDWPIVVSATALERLGHSTEEAVNGGILNLLVSALVNLPSVVKASKRDALFLTGGDAAPLSTALERAGVNHHIDQDIILDGLAYALP